MKVFLAAVVFVGLCVLGLGFNIFFRKDGHFPDTEISTNPEMRKLGIKCAKEEELEMLAGLLSGLSNRTYNVLRQTFLNAGPGAPECFIIQKL